MYISKTSKAYLNKVVQNDALMKNGVCTSAMKGVMSFLGTGATTALPDFNSSLNGIYSLTLNFCGDINTPQHMLGWEHGIAIQKIGDDLILYQAWVSKFTLENWLLLSGNVAAYSASDNSPMHDLSSSQQMKHWLDTLRKLGSLAKGNFADFQNSAEFLFGPPPDRAGLMQLEMAGNRGAKLQYHWKHRALKPIDEVIAPNPI